MLELTEASQVFSFENIAAEPVPSLLRGFSAPVTQRRLFTPKRMGPLVFRVKTDKGDPPIEDPGILASGDVG